MIRGGRAGAGESRLDLCRRAAGGVAAGQQGEIAGSVRAGLQQQGRHARADIFKIGRGQGQAWDVVGGDQLDAHEYTGAIPGAGHAFEVDVELPRCVGCAIDNEVVLILDEAVDGVVRSHGGGSVGPAVQAGLQLAAVAALIVLGIKVYPHRDVGSQSAEIRRHRRA